MNVDVELDLDADQIKSFFASKLEYIRTHNITLQNNIKDKLELLSSHVNTSSNTSSVEVDHFWSSIHNDCFILGLYLSNRLDMSIMVSNVLLNWNSSALITYRVAVYNLNTENNSFECSMNHSVRKRACVLLVIDPPIFLKQTSYNITGTLIYNIAQIKCNISIPNFNIKVNNFTSSNFEIKNSNIEDILSIYASSYIYEMIGNLDGGEDLVRVLERDCLLQKVSMGDKKCILVDSHVTRSFGGNLLDVEQTRNGLVLNVICRYEDAMLQCLHYLHQHINGPSLLPKAYAEVTNQERVSAKLSELAMVEFCVINHYYSNNNNSKLTYIAFRNKLIDIQLLTDQFYTQFSDLLMLLTK